MVSLLVLFARVRVTLKSTGATGSSLDLNTMEERIKSRPREALESDFPKREYESWKQNLENSKISRMDFLTPVFRLGN